MFEAGGIEHRIARAEHDVELRQLLKANAMDSWVQLAMEREPAYFQGSGLMGDSVTVIAHTHDGCVVGMYNCNRLPVHVNGQARNLVYLGGLRVNPRYRMRFRILKNGFESIRQLLPFDGSLPFYFTSIASENRVARRLLEAGLKGLPRYEWVDELLSLAMSTRQGKIHGLLRPAQADDVTAITELYNRTVQAYQFSAVLEESWLYSLDGSHGLRLEDFWVYEQAGELKACMAFWDQTAFKQIRVQGYRFPVNMLRPFYNGFARLTGRISLPPRGRLFSQAYWCFLALDETVTRLAVPLLQDGLGRAAQKGIESLVVGMSRHNPLCGILQQFPLQIYKTCIETVSWDSSLIRLQGPAQPEIALL
ncbi:MAG: hypothetical protein OEZ68_15880 [Gammaproteobacteria bacterium]|nr:hypothetical protein [Gammaproteobacteria bacterium]MDH5802281.1 hypothetical protein [Gammaproteobacteria bacterium]